MTVSDTAQCTPGQGSAKLHRLEENLGSTNAKLVAGDPDGIRQVLEGITIQGHRYSESSQRMIDRGTGPPTPVRVRQVRS